jgi:hypothetical protein
MAQYLMKYKGTYRILPELDIEFHDIPRDLQGNIDSSYDDLYISCRYGNKIYAYGHKNGNSKVMLLVAYIPSKGRGRNIKKQLDEMKFEYTDYNETDSEVEFHFKAKDIDTIAKLLYAKTAGASISPFSKRNLPKAKNVEITTEKIERYKTIIGRVEQGDLLIIYRITNEFLSKKLDKKYKAIDKTFDYKLDMKRLCMTRLSKEYIDKKGMFEEYLNYLENEIDKYYSNK